MHLDFASLQPHPCDRRALPAAVAHLVLVRPMKARVGCVVILCLALVGIGWVVVPQLVRLQPSRLDIHLAASLQWRSALLTSSNFRGPRRFTPGSGDIRVDQIEHGSYTLDIELPDERHAWIGYVHTDAGVRRRVEMDVSPAARRDSVHIRVTANKWFFPRRDLVFDEDVDIAGTTEQHPVFAM
jgi:hypothetical protein